MKAAPLTKKYGGKAIISDKSPENFEGEVQGNLNVVIEFPSKEEALGWYNDAEYAEAKRIRLEATETISFLLVEEKNSSIQAVRVILVKQDHLKQPFKIRLTAEFIFL